MYLFDMSLCLFDGEGGGAAVSRGGGSWPRASCRATAPGSRLSTGWPQRAQMWKWRASSIGS